MKKYTVIIVFVVLILSAAIYFDLITWKLPSEEPASIYASDPFAALRSSQGPFDGTATNGVWGSIANVYKLDQSIPADKALIDEGFLTLMAFFKGINVKPNGWLFQNNTFLQDEFDRFWKQNGNMTEGAIALGSLVA